MLDTFTDSILDMLTVCFYFFFMKGHRNDFVLPDRNKYVSMDQHFLASYRDLVIKTCHNRGAHATGGMAALLLPALEQKQQYQEILEKVRRLDLIIWTSLSDNSTNHLYLK